MKQTKKEVEVKEEAINALEVQETVKETLTEEEQLEKIIKDLKKKNKYIYRTNIAGETIIWRPLKRSEYKEIMSSKYSTEEQEDYFLKQEALTKAIVLYPKNIEELIEEMAGIAEIIANQCMDKSGFVDVAVNKL